MGFKVNKEKCLGCQICVHTCPEGIKDTGNGTSEVIDSKKVEECGGKDICPQGAIEEE